MEATLCFRMPLPAVKKPHCPLYKITTPGRHHRRLSFLASTATSTPFLKCGLRGAAHVYMQGCGIQACGLPHRNAGDEMASSSNVKSKGRAIGTAVALVFVVGIVCSRQALLTRVALAWPWPSPPAPQSETRTELRDLRALLDEAKFKMKERPSFRRMNDKRDSTSLISEWERSQEGPHDKYELGLSLIEILIDRGEYDKAREVCNKLQIIPGSDKDGRLPLRRLIVDWSMQLVSANRQIVEAANRDWEEYKRTYDFWSRPPQFPTKSG